MLPLLTLLRRLRLRLRSPKYQNADSPRSPKARLLGADEVLGRCCLRKIGMLRRIFCVIYSVLGLPLSLSLSLSPCVLTLSWMMCKSFCD